MYVIQLGWHRLLCLAVDYGWKPAGTSDRRYLPEEYLHLRLGGYEPSNGHTVNSIDSACLADALGRALPDIPIRRKSEEEKHLLQYPRPESTSDPASSMEASIEEICPVLDPELNLIEYWAGEHGGIIEVITFLRGGAFSIFGPEE
jgi:hypothetical protein